MSDLTVTCTVQEPPPEPKPDRRTVTLTMPYDVAVTLQSVLNKVGGDPATTFRKHTALLCGQLDYRGVRGDRFRFTGQLDGQPLNPLK